MQKKILLPLLLAGPVAVPAFAQDVTNPPVVADEQDSKYSEEQLKGFITQITSGNTAALSQIYGNQDGYTNSLKYILENLRISGADNPLFSEGATALQNQKNNLLEKYAVRENFPLTIPGVNGEGEIKTTATQLYIDLTGTNGITYVTEHQLYPNAEGKFTTELQILAVVQEFQTLIDDIKASNEKYETYTNNLGAREFLLNDSNFGINPIITKLEAIQENLEEINIPSSLRNELQEQLTEALDDANAYLDEINSKFPWPVTEDNLGTWTQTIISPDFREVIPGLQEQLQEVEDAVNNADADWKAYYDVNIVALTDLTASYTQLLNLLNNAKGVQSYEYPEGTTNTVTNWVNVYSDILNKLIGNDTKPGTASQLYLYTKENNTIDGIEGAAAYNEEHSCLENIKDAIEELDGLYNTWSNTIETQNANMQEALATTASMNAMVAGYKEKYANLSGKSLEAFNNGIADIEAAITAFNKYYEGEYAKHELDLESGSQEQVDGEWEGYLGLRQAVYVANGNFQNVLTAIAAISQLQSYLDSAEKTVKEAEEAANNGFELSAKVQPLFDEIQDEINEIEPVGGFNAKPIEDKITKVISDATILEFNYMLVSNILNNFDTAYTGFTNYIDTKKIESYDGTVFDKYTQFIAEWKEGATSEYVKLGAEISGYQASFSAAKAALGQDCIDAFNTLASTLQTAQKTFASNVLDQEVAFEKEGTGWVESGNSYGVNVPDVISVISPTFSALQNATEQYKERIGYDTAFNAINTLLNNVVKLGEQIGIMSETGAEAIAKYQAYDDQLNAFLVGEEPTYGEDGEMTSPGNLDTLDYYAAIDQYVQNMDKNWNAYKEMSDLLKQLQQTLYDVVDYNGGLTDDKVNNPEPAQAYFNTVLGQYQKDINAIKAEVEEWYQQMKAYDYENNGLDVKVADLQTKIENVLPWIQNNYLNYLNEQNVWSKNVTTAFATAKSKLSQALKDAQDQKQTALEEMIQGWLDTLASLQDKSTDPLNLDAVNAKSKSEFAEGGLYNPNGATTEEKQKPHTDNIALYQALIDKANSLVDELEGEGYHNAIIDADEAYLESWKGVYGDVNTSYLDGLDVYKYFQLRLTNPGWKEFVSEIVLNNAQLETYYKQLNELNDEFIEMYMEALGYDEDGKMTNDPTLISQSTYDSYKTQADAIQQDIKDYMGKFIDEMNGAADEYYPEVQEPALEELNKAKDALKAAGISTDCLEDFQDLYDLAVGVYGNSKDLDKDELEVVPLMIQKMKCGRMNEVANIFDDIIAPEYSKLEELQPAQTWAEWIQDWAEAAWDAAYGVAQKTISEKQKTVTDYAGYDGYEEDLDSFNSIVDAITALNDKVESTTEGLVDEYKDDYDELQRLLGELDTVYNKMQTASGNNEAYNDFKENQLPMLWKAFNAVNNYAYALAGWGYNDEAGEPVVRNQVHENLYVAIVDLEEAVDLNKTNSTYLDSVDGQVADLMKAIAMTYGFAAGYEKTFLSETMFPQLQEAFNEAKYYVQVTEANNKDLQDKYPETFWQDINTQMNDVIAKVKALATPTINGANYEGYENWPTSESVETFVNAAEGYEVALGELIAQLDGISGINAVKLTVDALNDRYDEILSNLDEGKAALADVDESIQEKYQKIYDALENALKGQMTSWTNVSDGNAVLNNEENAPASWVIVLEDKYLGALHVIEYQILETNKAVQDAQQQLENDTQNAALYEGFLSDYRDLLDRWEAVQATLEGYGVTEEVNFSINYTQKQFDEFLPYLESVKDELFKDATQAAVERKLKTITGCVDRTEARGTLAYDNNILAEAESLRSQIAEILANPSITIVPTDLEQINTEFAALSATLQNLKSDALGYDQYTSMDLLTTLMENAEANRDAFEALLDQINGDTYILGDINGDPDGAITIVDLQLLINFVGEGLTFDQVVEEHGVRAAYAADVLENGVYDVAAISKLTQMVQDYLAGDNTSNVRKLRARKVNAKVNIIDTENSVSLALVSEENGVRTYALMLNNPTEFIAGQLDLRANGTAKITNVYNAARSENHDVYAFDNDSYMRVILTSMQNERIAGSTGEVLYFDVEGKGDVTLDNIIFGDSNYEAHELSTTSTTGVNSIFDSVKEYGEKIYDAAGRLYNRVQKGINIIRHRDGSVTKEIRK